MKKPFSIAILTLWASLLLVGCGSQNVSFVKQTFSIPSVPYDRVRQGPILFTGLETSSALSTWLAIDSVANPIICIEDSSYRPMIVGARRTSSRTIDTLIRMSGDSVCSMCSQALRMEFAAGIPKLRFCPLDQAVDRDSASFEIRVRGISISRRVDNIFGSLVAKTTATIALDLIDKNNGTVQFELCSLGEAIDSRYSNPPRQAFQLAARRVVDHIKSGGEN